MKELIDYSRSVNNEGDDTRIQAVMIRALKGEKIKVAFLGGSITQGSLSSTPETCYAYLTYLWWKENFPNSEVSYVNAGIGGTTSHLGTGRVQEEVLSHCPDFILTEFSVNDDDYTEHFKETYEGLVRRILKAPFHPALMLMNNVRYDDGGNAEAIHHPIAVRYNVPCVSMKPTIYKAVAEGKIADRRTITPDDLHPNDAGHMLVSSVICYYLAQVKERAVKTLAEGKEVILLSRANSEPVLAGPITPNAYESAVRKRNDALKPVSQVGFTKDETPQQGPWDCFKKGYYASEKGASIVFEEEFSCLAVQYRKTVRKPAPVAQVIIDDQVETAVVLDANFDQTWGDCLYLETVVDHAPKGKHKVEIKITDTTENDAENFYLVSLILA